MKLSKEEMQQLIDTYRSELRMLAFRTREVSDTLKDLEKAERAAKPKKKAGRPAKKAAKKAGRKAAKKAAKKATKKAAKRGRPAKKAAKRGRPAKKAAKRGRPAKKATKRGRPAKKAIKRGRPAKKAAKRGRPAKKAAAGKSTGKGYRLNVWDEIVLKTVGTGKKIGVFADFFKAAKGNAASKGMSDKDLYARINQSLHKLANKRGTLKKVKHEGRGFGYQRT